MLRVALLVAVCATLLSCNALHERSSGPADAPEALPHSPNGNFILSVSNQSFAVDPVDIHITIDGKTAVDDTFNVDTQHSWKSHAFALTPGSHTLEATSRKGRAQLKTIFTTGEKNWAVVGYWYYPKERGGTGPTERKFSFHIGDKPIAFR